MAELGEDLLGVASGLLEKHLQGIHLCERVRDGRLLRSYPEVLRIRALALLRAGSGTQAFCDSRMSHTCGSKLALNPQALNLL